MGLINFTVRGTETPVRFETWYLDTFPSGSPVRGILCLRQNINTHLSKLDFLDLGSICETSVASVPICI
jgi:hypothetical protein